MKMILFSTFTIKLYLFNYNFLRIKIICHLKILKVYFSSYVYVFLQVDMFYLNLLFHTDESDVLLDSNIPSTSSGNLGLSQRNNDFCEYTFDSDISNEEMSIESNSDEETYVQQVIDEEFVDADNCDPHHYHSPPKSFINDNSYDSDDDNIFQNFFNMPDLQNIMFEVSGLSAADVVLMIVSYSIRFSISNTARDGLFELIKVLAGPRFKKWNYSKYRLAHLYNPPDKVISYNFYCQYCYTLLIPSVSSQQFSNQSMICEKCKTRYHLSMSSSNYFISIDLAYQLKILFNYNQEAQSQLLNNIKKIKKNLNKDGGVLQDIHSSRLYKITLNRKYKENNNDLFATYNFNTDGAPLFHSSKRSMWPLMISINELPAKLRFKNILLAGLFVGEKELTPAMMNLFLKPFVDQAKVLETQGIIITQCDTYNQTTKINLKFLPLFSSVDSVARPSIQNRLQFNGYYGCSWCYLPGKYLYRSMRYPITDAEIRDRSHDLYIRDVSDLENSTKFVCGVKGPSILLELSAFDMVWGFPIDYMHGILLGVTKQIWDMWSTAGCKVHFKSQDIKKISDRLQKLTPVHEIHRLPRSFFDKAKWKASEWRSWLLFYSLICLRGILPDPALHHLALLIKSVYVLLKCNITEAELNDCEYNLVKFVGMFEVIYGVQYMTFNVHSLLHVVRSVKQTGPLWATSTFPYESMIYQLKKHVHGPDGVINQISKKQITKGTLIHAISKIGKQESCKQFCTSYLFSPVETVNTVRVNSTYCNMSIILIGPKTVLNIQDFDQFFASNVTSNISSYSRCIYNNTLFHSTKYNRPSRTNDTVAKLKFGKFIKIEQFLHFDNNCYIEVVQLEVQPIQYNIFELDCDQIHYNFDSNFSLLQIDHIFIVTKLANKSIINIDNISEKCLFFTCDGTQIISTMPNMLEIQ